MSHKSLNDLWHDFLTGTVTIPTTGSSSAVTGTADNDDDVTVDATAGGVTLKAANANRKIIIIQNVGAQPIRVTIDGSAPTATHGIQLAAGDSVTFTAPYIPVAIVKAIREGGTNSTANVTEIV